MSSEKFLRTSFLQDTFGQQLLISRRNVTFKRLILNKFFHSINIVDTLYLMGRNVDFAFYDPQNLKNINQS